jgi:hypothetical protein
VVGSWPAVMRGWWSCPDVGGWGLMRPPLRRRGASRAGWWGHADGMWSEPVEDTDPVARVADEVGAGQGPVALVRPGHRPIVVVVSEEQRPQLGDVASIEATAWWRRDGAERTAAGESLTDEDGPDLDEATFRGAFGHLLPGSSTA